MGYGSLFKRVLVALAGCLSVGGVLSLMSIKAMAVPTINKSEAAAIAQAQFGGKLFGQIKKTESGSGAVVYEVRLDDGGRVIIVHVSGDGKIINKK